VKWKNMLKSPPPPRGGSRGSWAVEAIGQLRQLVVGGMKCGVAGEQGLLSFICEAAMAAGANPEILSPMLPMYAAVVCDVLALRQVQFASLPHGEWF
jgi:hypothetical protein